MRIGTRAGNTIFESRGGGVFRGVIKIRGRKLMIDAMSKDIIARVIEKLILKLF